MKADILYPLFKQLHTAAVAKLASEIKALADDHTLNTPAVFDLSPRYDDFETPADEFVRSDFDAIWSDRS